MVYTMINWYYAEVVGQPCLSIAIVQNSLEWTQSQMNSIRTDQLIFISCCRIFILSYEELYSMKNLCYWTIGIIDTLWISLLLYYILYYSLAADNAWASFPGSLRAKSLEMRLFPQFPAENISGMYFVFHLQVWLILVWIL